MERGITRFIILMAEIFIALFLEKLNTISLQLYVFLNQRKTYCTYQQNKNAITSNADITDVLTVSFNAAVKNLYYIELLKCPEIKS